MVPGTAGLVIRLLILALMAPALAYGQEEDPDSEPTGRSDADEDIFLRSSVSKDQVYVQEELLYTLRLYHRIGFHSAVLTSPQSGDAVIQQLGNDRNYEETIGGVDYTVRERRFVVIPQSSGDIVIPPVSFNAIMAGSDFGLGLFSSLETDNGREIDLSSEAVSVSILPRPASFPPDAAWLPASSLTLEAEWDEPPDDLTVGESVTRTLTITATGLPSSLLPDVTYRETDGLNFYPGQTTREDMSGRNGMIGSYTESTAIVPSRAGDFTLPAITIPWWNTETDSRENTRLPAYTLHVTDPENTVSDVAADPAADSAGNSPSGLRVIWIAAAVVFTAAWLFSSVMWMYKRRDVRATAAAESSPDADTAGAPDVDAAFNLFASACEHQQTPEIKHSLIEWGQSFFKDPDILTLEDLKQYLDGETLLAQLQALEITLYSSSRRTTVFRADVLLEEVRTLHENERARGKS